MPACVHLYVRVYVFRACDLLSALAHSWTADFLTKTFVSKPQFDPGGFFFITYRSETVGTAFCWRDSGVAADVGRLHFLAVHPRHRHRGIGTALVRLVLQRLGSQGCRQATLRTEPHRADALRLYEKEGFRAAK